MMAIGKMICRKVMELKPGLMVQNMKDSIKRDRRMDKENIHGLMEVNIMDNGCKIRFLVVESISG